MLRSSKILNKKKKESSKNDQERGAYESVDDGSLSWGARTEKAGLPARATGTNLLPELRYVNKSSAHSQNRLVQVLTGNPLSPVFRNELFIPVSRTCSTRSKII